MAEEIDALIRQKTGGKKRLRDRFKSDPGSLAAMIKCQQILSEI